MSTLINNGNNVFHAGTTVSSEKLIEQAIRNELTRQQMDAYKFMVDAQEMVTQTTGIAPFTPPKRRNKRLLLL